MTLEDTVRERKIRHIESRLEEIEMAAFYDTIKAATKDELLAEQSKLIATRPSADTGVP